MKHTQRSFILCIIAFITGCTTVSTVKYQPVYSDIQIKEIYQVRVRTGNITLDRLTYNRAFHEFGKYLKLATEGPFTGYIDISFRSTAKNYSLDQEKATQQILPMEMTGTRETVHLLQSITRLHRAVRLPRATTSLGRTAS